MISSQGLPKFRHRFALADRQINTGLEEKSSKQLYIELVIIEFQTKKPSVMHTKHDRTKSQGGGSKAIVIARKSPFC